MTVTMTMTMQEKQDTNSVLECVSTDPGTRKGKQHVKKEVRPEEVS